MFLNLPNTLTISRIAVIPVITALFFIDARWAVWTNVVLYGLAGATDFLDGYLARSTGQISAFGRFLDSIADKLIVSIALFLAVAFDRLEGIWIIPAIIIIFREIMIAGLREFFAPYNIQLKTKPLARWKVLVQMLSIAFLIAGPYGPELIPYAIEIGKWGLLAAAILTATTGWDYWVDSYREFKRLHAEGKI